VEIERLKLKKEKKIAIILRGMEYQNGEVCHLSFFLMAHLHIGAWEQLQVKFVIE
jgi:hypothetical protein